MSACQVDFIAVFTIFPLTCPDFMLFGGSLGMGAT